MFMLRLEGWLRCSSPSHPAATTFSSTVGRCNFSGTITMAIDPSFDGWDGLFVHGAWPWDCSVGSSFVPWKLPQVLGMVFFYRLTEWEPSESVWFEKYIWYCLLFKSRMRIMVVSHCDTVSGLYDMTWYYPIFCVAGIFKRKCSFLLIILKFYSNLSIFLWEDRK